MNLLALWEKVWSFREEHRDVWFAPSPTECIMYALSEMGEYYDALVWRMRPDDARAHLKERVPEVELADTIIMLVSAFPEKEMFRGSYVKPLTDRPIEALKHLAQTFMLIEDKQEEAIWRQWAYLTLRILIAHVGYEKSLLLVDEKLAKIKTKVLGR